MKVSVIQLGYDDRETVQERTARVVALVESQAGHDLVVLPELWPAGGFDYPRWNERAEPVDGPVAKALSAAAAKARVTLHGGSIVERAEATEAGGRGLWNTSVVFGPDGGLLATYRKIHRFGFGEGEPALLDAGNDVVVVDVPVARGEAVKVGLSTCYDLRFPELYRRLLDAGAEVLVVPAAWPMRRVAHWTLLGQARAIENQCVVVACNTAGTHAGHEMGGHSQVVDATGKVLASAGADEQVISADLDIAAIDHWRRAFPVLPDRRLR
ncbi:apolipoprotein acyltransferase [Humibacillus sp. DSM 29435]|uniref:carbon-nitrogen family hydrolase n=1 Tax=Humibacillus sp. DSM 29435 TaxID=1869167 RepID=UPI00087203B8|nr:carbon-nitrogen family hydrolase [Humibacillus sp. DSM 29435]OFE17028.1 apolipoprotein acyltransferase [Humibacillus sp. DSM 29435]